LDVLSADVLDLVLAQLPLHSLLCTVVPACRRLAIAAERALQAHCKAFGWRPTRHARGFSAAVFAEAECAWRVLVRSRVCAVCSSPSSNFPARRPYGGTSRHCGAVAFRLCAECARDHEVQRRAQAEGLEIDSSGLDGKPLFPRQFRTPLGRGSEGFARR
jgi:hypothetical protein